MRLRKKPWVPAALEEYSDIVIKNADESFKGKWREVFERNAPLFVELGTGKGRFISQLAERHPEINFIGIEAQQDVIIYAARKVREKGLTNVRLLVFDINKILDIFAVGEVNRFYINFCDPWPKARHAKRRLTHGGFLDKYRDILADDGAIFFKTDNRSLFDFSVEQFAEKGLKVDNLTYDLHNSNYEDNIMTEYEEKFSKLGTPINRCEIRYK